MAENMAANAEPVAPENIELENREPDVGVGNGEPDIEAARPGLIGLVGPAVGPAETDKRKRRTCDWVSCTNLHRLILVALLTWTILSGILPYPAVLGDEIAVTDRYMRFDISPTGTGVVFECEEACNQNLNEGVSSILFEAAQSCLAELPDEAVAPLRTSGARAFRPWFDPFVLRGLTLGNFDASRNVTVRLCSSDPTLHVDAAALQSYAWRLLQRANLPAVLYRLVQNRSTSPGCVAPCTTTYEFSVHEIEGWSLKNPTCAEWVSLLILLFSVLFSVLVAGALCHLTWGIACEQGVGILPCVQDVEYSIMSVDGDKHGRWLLADLPMLVYLRADASAEEWPSTDPKSRVARAVISALLTSGMHMFAWWMGSPAGINPARSMYAIPIYLLGFHHIGLIFLECFWNSSNCFTSDAHIIIARYYNLFTLSTVGLFGFSWTMLVSWFCSSLAMAKSHAEQMVTSFLSVFAFLYVAHAGWMQYSRDLSELVKLSTQIVAAIKMLPDNVRTPESIKLEQTGASTKKLRDLTLYGGVSAAAAVAILLTVGVAATQHLWGSQSSWLDRFSFFLAVGARIVTRAQLEDKKRELEGAFNFAEEHNASLLPDSSSDEDTPSAISFGRVAGHSSVAEKDASLNDARLVELCEHAYTPKLHTNEDFDVVQKEKDSFRAVVWRRHASHVVSLKRDTRGHQEAAAVVAFRGSITDPKVDSYYGACKNWLTNANVNPSPLNTSADASLDSLLQVHKGFSDAANTFLEDGELLKKICNAAPPTAPIVLTGHSLGGALALLIGVRLALENPDLKDRIHVVTFGAPMVFLFRVIGGAPSTADFERVVSDFDHRIHRVVNECDVVPTLPGLTNTDDDNSMAFQYGHVGKEYMLGDLAEKSLCGMIRTSVIEICKCVTLNFLAPGLAVRRSPASSILLAKLTELRKSYDEVTRITTLKQTFATISESLYDFAIAGHLLAGDMGYIRAVNLLHHRST